MGENRFQAALSALRGSQGRPPSLDLRKRLAALGYQARRAPLVFAGILLAAVILATLEVVSIASVSERIAAIAEAHGGGTPGGPAVAELGAYFGALVKVRIFGVVLALVAFAGALLRPTRLPVLVIVDRALFALVGAGLAITVLSVLVAESVTAPRRVLDWGRGDAALLLAVAALCAILVRVTRVRARWLDRVRHGLDRDWSLELLHASVDRQLPLLAGQRKGDAVLLSNVDVPGRPPVTTALARVDYAEPSGLDRRRVLYMGLGALSVVGALVLAGALVSPARPAVAVTPLGAPVKAFALPDAKPPWLHRAKSGASEPAETADATGGRGLEDDALAAPLLVDPDGKMHGGTGVIAPAAEQVVDVSPDGSCVRDLDGQILCQKHDVNGYVRVKNAVGAVSFASRGEHGCAVVYGGEVRCWKDESANVLIPTGTPPEARMIRELPPASKVAVAETFACAITLDRAVRCWTDGGAPHAIPGAEGCVAVAAGTEHACAVQDKGTVLCWGKNDLGQAGPSGTGDDTLAVPVPDVDGAVEVALGATHSCARLGSGAVTCWGFLDSATWSTAPRALPELAPALRLLAREGAACALQSNRLVCSGDRIAP